jgi:hypothetical protein
MSRLLIPLSLSKLVPFPMGLSLRSKGNFGNAGTPVKYSVLRSQAFWERERGKVQEHTDFTAFYISVVLAFPPGSGKLGTVG